jgi:DNA-binding LacI/PurR family transcriptional regulator
MAEPSPKAIRLTDVAERAGVSTATVSRVLNGLGPTSEDVRTRVLRAAKELDYHPNWLARSLRARRTNTVGLVLPDIENPFFTSLVKGAERAAGTRGWNLILCNSDEDVEREEALVRTLAERKIDGLLLCAAAGPHDFLARYRGHLPLVAVNRLIPGASVPSVTADNEQGAYDAASHLLAKGLRPLALLLGTPNLSTTEARLAGCRRAAEALGLAPEDMFLKVGYGRTDEGYKAAGECLDETPRPRAIVAFNNLMAEAALRAIHDRGLRCPEDVALIGFDDFRSAAAMTPPLTVVEQDPVGMGEKAVEVLGDMVASGEAAVPNTVLRARLLLRASCGCSASTG